MTRHATVHGPLLVYKGHGADSRLSLRERTAAFAERKATIAAWERLPLRCWAILVCLLCIPSPAGFAAEAPPLFEKNRPAWEIKFADVDNAVMSVAAGESKKTFHDPLTNKDVKWEQDLACPSFTVFNGELYCVYRAYGDDDEWRLGLCRAATACISRDPTSRCSMRSRPTNSSGHCSR